MKKYWIRKLRKACKYIIFYKSANLRICDLWQLFSDRPPLGNNMTFMFWGNTHDDRPLLMGCVRTGNTGIQNILSLKNNGIARQIYTVHFWIQNIFSRKIMAIGKCTLCILHDALLKCFGYISMKGYCDHCKYARRLCGPYGSCEVRTKRIDCSQSHTANEGPVRIQNKCLVLTDVFPEMKLRGLIISKTEL
jgi:hypothetical protein